MFSFIKRTNFSSIVFNMGDVLVDVNGQIILMLITTVYICAESVV